MISSVLFFIGTHSDEWPQNNSETNLILIVWIFLVPKKELKHHEPAENPSSVTLLHISEPHREPCVHEAPVPPS